MKKTKKIWIGIISIIAIIIAIIIIYIKTDWLKTKEQLFWKYFIFEKNKVVNVFSNKEIKDFSDELKKSSYIKETNFSVTSKYNLIKPINIAISEKGDNKQQLCNININLKYDNKDIDNSVIVKDDNYFLIKNDKIKLGYIGFENENLKQVAKQLGLKNVDFIPNKIEKIDYLELLCLNQNEWGYILMKYIPICRKYVNNENYKMEKNVKIKEIDNNINLYKVEVSEQQLKNLIINILNELQGDETTLNIICKKIKLVDSENKYTDINKIQRKIAELKGKVEQLETSNEKFLSIIIYKNENNVEKIEIVIEKGINFSVQVENENKVVIKRNNCSNDKQIDLKTFKDVLSNMVNTIEEITYEKNIINGKENIVDINIICRIGFETITLKYDYVEKIEKNVEDIIRKKEIEYIELKKMNMEILKLLMEKLFNISDF